MKIRIKKLDPDAIIPKYQTKGASGFDLHALEDVMIAPGETKLVSTGLAFDVGPGYELQIRPRSGLSLKTYLRVVNSPGTVDSDFRGCISIIMCNTTPVTSQGDAWTKNITIKKGDRVAQGVICPVVQADIEEVEVLNDSQRGSGSFGSTGTN